MPDALPFEFHFLRPLWLVALIPVIAIVVLILRRGRPEAQWGDVIAPNLLKQVDFLNQFPVSSNKDT